MDFFTALVGIMIVNIVLSGDNAVVIAMASRCLPPRQQRLAILWGSGGAVFLRILLTFVAVALLQIPYLQFGGGLLLIWIAAKLLADEKHDEEMAASDSLWRAIRTIIWADLIMSLDNTLAIAAIAGGNYLLLIIGLAMSIPLIIFGSQLIIVIMNKYPIVVYIGAALIAWTAGEMVMQDQEIGPHILQILPRWLIPAGITVGVVGYGLISTRRRKNCGAGS